MMNPIKIWFHNLFKLNAAQAASAYMARLDAAIDQTTLSLTIFNRVANDIQHDIQVDERNPLRALGLLLLKKRYSEQVGKAEKDQTLTQSAFQLFKDWRQTRESLSNSKPIDAILNATTQIQLNRALIARGQPPFDDIAVAAYLPWLKLNEKIQAKRIFIDKLYQLGVKIAHATSLPQLNKYLHAGQSLCALDQKKYQIVVSQWCTRARQRLEQEYYEKIKDYYTTVRKVHPPILISIPSPELMQLMNDKLINKQDVFNLKVNMALFTRIKSPPALGIKF